MRLFCDQCGTEFGDGALRPDSKFCSLCGKPLSTYIKEQCAHLPERSPKAGNESDQRHRTAPPGYDGVKRRASSTPSKKRKAADAHLSEVQGSDDETPRKTRSNHRAVKTNGETDTNDEDLETSTTDNPESTEGLGKGKRIRKTTQRYTDETVVLPRVKKTDDSHHATRSKTSTSVTTTPTQKNNNSLSQILNSAPTISQLHPTARAALSVPLSLSAFKLPPPIPVPEIGLEKGRILKREAMALVLGGSLKTTFPYPRNRAEGPPYACIKESENDLIPANPGEHGILVVKSLPDALPREGFVLFTKAKSTIYWTYMGTYKIVHTFTMSREQWRKVDPRTRNRKVVGTLRSQWGRQWCLDKGLQPTDEGMMAALDEGVLRWQASVIQCIDYDVKLLHQLLKA